MSKSMNSKEKSLQKNKKQTKQKKESIDCYLFIFYSYLQALLQL